MTTLPHWLLFAISALACYRLALLLSDDDGPYRFLKKFRSFLKREAKHNAALRKSAVQEGITCLRCTGIWVATPVALYVYYRDQLPIGLKATADIFILSLALSAAAILIHRLRPEK